MELIMLGTGNALVTKVYNTCFILRGEKGDFLVDGGGGNGLFVQMEKAGAAWDNIHHIFLTHCHVDHIMGIIWMIRMIGQNMSKGKYEGEVWIYGHAEVLETLETISRMLLASKASGHIGKEIHLVPVSDGEKVEILGNTVTFFDLQSVKARQMGMMLEGEGGKRLSCCGDEPCRPAVEPYVRDSDWLLHEAFCLAGQADVFHPYEKSHSTVKDACELAQRLHVKSLLLYHTEDQNIARRRELYTGEGKTYFTGGLYVPEDLERIRLW